MKINKREVEYYDAIFMSFIDSPSLINTEFYTSGMRRIPLTQEITPKIRILKLFFEHEDDISLFIAEIKNGCVIDYENFRYQCYLNDSNPVLYNHVGNGMYEVQFSLSAIKMKPEQIYNLTSSISNINVMSTLSSPAIYSVYVKGDVDELNINGNVIKNVKIGDLIIIDGYNQTVKCNDENKFTDVTLSNNAFPLFSPGINKIEIDDIDKLDVKLKVYPVWI